jgi:hypothetical protein
MKTDTKDFLHSIHILWTPILQRFSERDKDLTVLTRVLELIILIAQLSGDFISKRFVDELWPQLKRKCQEESERKTQIGLFVCLFVVLFIHFFFSLYLFLFWFLSSQDLISS